MDSGEVRSDGEDGRGGRSDVAAIAQTKRMTSAAAVFKQQSTLKMMTVEAVVAISLRGRQTADNTGRGKEGVVRRQ